MKARRIVHRTAYAGTHMVNTGAGAIEREVPAIVDPALREKALSRLQENKRYSGGKPGRSYLLRGLVYCDYCGTAYVGASKTNAARRRYHYYNCCGRLSAYQDKREAGLSGRASPVARGTRLGRRAKVLTRPW